jgi:hypothetical protein
MISPYSQYPSAHQDVFNALTEGDTAARNLATAQRHADMGRQSRDFAQQYVLQGLQNDIAAQSQKNNLTQARLEGVFRPTSYLLQGLFQ